MRTRLAFTTIATLTRGQSARRQLILTTGEMCRTSPRVLWPHLDVPFLIHRQTISCYYMVNETKAVSFDYKPRGGELATQVGQGHLTVQMRLAYGKDDHLLETRSLPHDC